MKRHILKFFALAWVAVALSGCAGACVSSGGIVDICKNGWTASECAEWNDDRVNGARWQLRGGTCQSLGYSVECCDGSFGLRSRDCC